MKRTLRPSNLIDRAVTYLSPGAGLRRLEARARLDQVAAMSGGYDGGDNSRRGLRFFNPGGGDANQDSLPRIQNLRQNSRGLVRNDPIAGAAIDRKATNVVGWGLVPSPQIDREFLGLTEEQASAQQEAAAREFALWAESQNADASDCQTFREQQDLAARACWESGDSFAVLTSIDRPGWPYSTAVQLYEADQISTPQGAGFTVAANVAEGPGKGNTILSGLEVGARGESVAVHIRAQHPGAPLGNRAAAKWSRVEMASASGRRQVLHLYTKRRIGQVRGVPMLAPVIEQLKQLGDYTKAEIFAAVLGAMVTVVHTSKNPHVLRDPNPAAGGAVSDAAPDQVVEPGTMLHIGQGDEYSVPVLGRPNSGFEQFFQAIVRLIGARLEIPFEVLIQHFTASYSASRAALEVAWQCFRRDRWWLETRYCQPIYDAVIAEAVGRGRLNWPGFFEDPVIAKAWLGAEWVGPARVQIDPKKENEADAIAEDRNWKTGQKITAEKTGGSYRRNVAVRATEKELVKVAGLAPQAAQAPLLAPPREDDSRPERPDAPEDETAEDT